MKFAPEEIQNYPIELTSLPTGWGVATVGEMANAVEPGFPSGKHNREGRGTPHIRPMNVSRDGKIDLSYVKYVEDKSNARLADGDVLFNNTNSPALVGKTAVIRQPDNWAFSNHMTRIRPAQGITSAYLAHHLHYLWMSGYFRGRLVNHVNQASISSSRLANTVPLVLAPTREQERIVAAIEEQFSRLDAGVAALESARLKLKRMRAAVLQAAVTGQLTGVVTPVGAVRPPADWEFASPDDIAAIKRNALAIGPFGSNLKVSDYTSQGVPLVFVKQVRSGVFAGADTRFISEDKAVELSAHRVQGGDVLVTKMGEPPGDATVYPENQPDAVITADVIKLSLREGVLAEYVAMALNSRLVRDQIVAITKGVAQQKVSLARFRQSVRIPLPPAEDQAAIVKEVSARMREIDRVDTQISTELARAASLRSSILATAFSGRLVPQEPADEPAPRLLERIATERASSHSHRPKQRRKPQPLQEEVTG